MKIVEQTSLRAIRRTRRGGFTLIEVMVSVFVIAIAVSSIFLAMNMGFSMTAASRENLRATQIMLDKMEGVRLYDWAEVTNTSFLNPTFTSWFYETNNIGQANAQGYGVQYDGVVQVAPVPASMANNYYSSNMVQVTVTVHWTSAGNGWSYGSNYHTRSMATYVAMNGMQNYIYNSY